MARAGGHDPETILDGDYRSRRGGLTLIRGDNVYFVASGITDGALLEGVRRTPGIRTSSVVLRSRSGTVRRVVADHLTAKWYGPTRDGR